MPARAIRARLRHRACLQAPSVIDEIFGVFAEFAVQHLGIGSAYAGQVVCAVLRQTPRNARPNAPDIGDGAVKPHLALERFGVKLSDAVGRVLGTDIKRYLRLKHILADARRGRNTRDPEGGIHELARERARVGTV